MATHSSILAWEIPWIGEPGGLQSMGSQKNQTRLSDFHSLSEQSAIDFQITLRGTGIQVNAVLLPSFV